MSELIKIVKGDPVPVFLLVLHFCYMMYILYMLIFRMGKKTGLPTMKNPPPPPEKKASVKDAYEFLRTRALNLEGVQDAHPNEMFPLWINIDDVYHILSLLEHDQLQVFLNETGLCYDAGFGCDADDIEMPEFPAAKMPKK